MFSGPTAAEFAVRARLNPSGAPRPALRGLKCDHWDGGPHRASNLTAIYGVGCTVASWAPRCDSDRHSVSQDDDTFYCEGCEHYHQTNTSWELHYSNVDGEMLCLKCAASAQILRKPFWISDAGAVTTEWVRSRPHFPLELAAELVKSTGEGWSLDGMSGEEIAGLSSTVGGGLDGTVRKIQEAAALILDAGASRVGAVITRAYQFAIYLELVTEVRP